MSPQPRKFAQDERGNAATLFALALLPVAALTGFGTDYTRAVREQVHLQAATDRAALAALTATGLTDQQRVEAAQQALAASGYPGAHVTAQNGTVRIAATKAVSAFFMGITGRHTIDVSARASAAMTPAAGGASACVLALDATATNAINFTGNATFTGVGCGVHANSSANPALAVTGSATVEAAAICAVGTATQSRAEGASPRVRSGCPTIADPLAALPRPDGTGSCRPNPDLKPNKTVTLAAGVYCGGLDVQGTVRLVDGGIYVVRDGALRINSKAEVTGRNVLIYLTGNGAELRINGGARLELSAPTTGSLKGVLIYQDPAATNVGSNDLGGNAASVLSGIVYAPRHTLTISGNTSLGQAGTALSLIASRVEFTGSSVVRTDIGSLVSAGAPSARLATVPALTQ